MGHAARLYSSVGLSGLSVADCDRLVAGQLRGEALTSSREGFSPPLLLLHSVRAACLASDDDRLKRCWQLYGSRGAPRSHRVERRRAASRRLPSVPASPRSRCGRAQGSSRAAPGGDIWAPRKVAVVEACAPRCR
jgi:hypothetical protein